MDDRFDALTRREALKWTALLLGGMVAVPALAGCSGPETEGASGERAAAAPAAGTAQPGQPIGVQLYTVRDRMQQDVAATLASIAQIGYREVETAGLYDLSAEQFRALLDQHGLASPSGHYPIQALRENLDATLATAQALGQRWVIVPWLGEEERTAEGYRRVAAELNRFGQTARERGLRVAYHNHEFEFAPLPGGRTGFDILLEETDPDLVDFELDLFWATHAGVDPMELITRHSGRFPIWHVKDMADIRGAKRMVPVGQGEIDFGRLFAQAEQLGLRHFFVEHDNPEDPVAFLRTSYQHVSQLLT
jgi:sugar phosphate isomerase/epimerase